MKRMMAAGFLAVMILRGVSVAQTHFTFTGKTGNNMTVIVPTNANPTAGGVPLMENDEIGVFSPAGLCVGATVWDGVNNKAIAVWGDDGQTPQRDGLLPGEAFSFRVWRASSGLECTGDTVLFGQGTNTYAVDGWSVVSLLKATCPVAPAITAQPQSRTVTAGDAVEFSVTATGVPAPSYQWRKDGVNIGGATGPTYTISSAAASHAGAYTVVVSNSAGSVTSTGAVLTVNPAPTAPTITTQPASQTVTAGQSVSFTVVAGGTAPFSYQWRKDGSDISGASSATYTIASAAASHAGSYTVIVSNSVGNVISSAATLTVNPASVAPAITTQPQSRTVMAGDTVQFSVTATGTPAPSYQWRKDGVNISGATASTYTVAAVTASHAGTYTVEVSNSAGAVISSGAVLTVTIPAVAPRITGQPLCRICFEGETVELSIGASGTAPITFQWRRDGSNISGATGSILVLSTVSTADEGTYTCVVTNPVGSVTSAGAVLAVKSIPVILVHPRDRTVQTGDPLTLVVSASGTPPLSFQWKKNGTALSGRTAAELSLSSVAQADSGLYSCEVRNVGGAAESRAARISVVQPLPEPPPAIFLSRRSLVFQAAGTQGLSASNSGGGVLPALVATRRNGAQWLGVAVDNSPVNGARLTLTATVEGLAPGSFQEVVSVSGAGVSPESLTVSLIVGETVSIPTRIEIAPLNATCPTGGTIIFTATVYDQQNRVMSVLPSWAVSRDAGTITGSGVFTAGTKSGSYTVAAVHQGSYLEATTVFHVTDPVAPLRLVSPRGGEVFQVGQRTAIEFAADPAQVTGIEIDLSTNDGSSWSTIGGPFRIGDAEWGAFAWTVPEAIGGSSTISALCRIRVRATTGNRQVESPGLFSIVAPVAQVIAPEGGVVQLSEEVKVQVPSTAMTGELAATEVSIVQTRTTVAPPSGFQLEGSGDVFVFTPHGVEFDDWITISLPYTGARDRVRILRRSDEQTSEWEVITDFWFDEENAPGIVFFKVKTFSVYAVSNREELTAPAAPIPVRTGSKTVAPGRSVEVRIAGRTLRMRFAAPGSHTVSVYRLDGSKVGSVHSTAESIHFDLSSLSMGTYVLKVTGPEGVMVLRRTMSLVRGGGGVRGMDEGNTR